MQLNSGVTTVNFLTDGTAGPLGKWVGGPPTYEELTACAAGLATTRPLRKSYATGISMAAANGFLVNATNDNQPPLSIFLLQLKHIETSFLNPTTLQGQIHHSGAWWLMGQLLPWFVSVSLYKDLFNYFSSFSRASIMNIACLCEAGFQIICPQICNDFASVFLNKLNLVGQVQCLNACRPQWDSQSMPFLCTMGSIKASRSN